MMTKIFKKSDKNDFIIHWLKENKAIEKENVLNIVFNDIKCQEAGLWIENLGSPDILWIKNDYFLRSGKEYCEYIKNMYSIVGISFHTEKEADKFKEALEKKCMWNILRN